MAFPVPAHLPRMADPHDVTSSILAKIDEATTDSLNSAQARSWMNELEKTIRETQDSIHERIHSNIPTFERQRDSALALQARLQSLSQKVKDLDAAVSDPGSGFVSTLLSTLHEHAALARTHATASARWAALEQVSNIRTQLATFISMVSEGRLVDAVSVGDALDALFDSTPEYLRGAEVIKDMEHVTTQSRARLEEQLSLAYSRCALQYFVLSSVFVLTSILATTSSALVLRLADVIRVLSFASLQEHLNVMRRDVTRLLERVLAQNVPSEPVFVVCTAEVVSMPASEGMVPQAEAEQAVLTLQPVQIPESAPITFSPAILQRTVSDGLLRHLLVPHLPGASEDLPAFLQLVRNAVYLEDKCMLLAQGKTSLNGITGTHEREDAPGPVRAWAKGVGGHYERRRREFLISEALSLSTSPVDETGWGFDDDGSADDAWGLDDETAVVAEEGAKGGTQDVSVDPDTSPSSKTASSLSEDAWGLDDDMDVETPPDTVENPASAKKQKDDGDAWAWEDGGKHGSANGDEDEHAWDDPWADEPAPKPSTPPPATPAPAPAPAKQTRLEKLAAKARQKSANGTAVSATASPATTHSPHLSRSLCTVSGRLRLILQLVSRVLAEGVAFANGAIDVNIVSLAEADATRKQGTIILQTASAVLDVFRAVYPTTLGLKADNVKCMQYSNDCLYMAAKVPQMLKSSGELPAAVGERMLESARRLGVVGESWYWDTIRTQGQAVNDMVGQMAAQLSVTADQETFDACEAMTNEVLQHIRQVARPWKGVLLKQKYYTAIGHVVDEAVLRLMDDILALPDIPEVESHRISELCRILKALESLFVDEDGSLVVAYVASWLKFSYLSELLEASMADITYLFEEGALVDFETDELVRLVRALFADTPLRANTIQTIEQGRPPPPVL
ncbi:hypothetical protein FISHEDRAFT_36158 [Fistulina hepatica ATCC 64428]|uniref:ZW10 C-terminal helical domain-containing protein n=1 Tax=Fistulina hepatica ATCC 64428 TaxID=1128425 RepID=A0A0D7AJB6_9AGAR|nr:hypothetical protein FISHEDRAFT_36158 [Fistulina hepatica ATCC 64428]